MRYRNDKLFSKILALSITGIIIGINVILKLCVVALVSWIGEDTVSKQKGSVVKGAFLGQFFNTGFLLLLVNSNMTEHEPKFFTKFFKGTFYDYEPQWYAMVGKTILQTMAINSILPY